MSRAPLLLLAPLLAHSLPWSRGTFPVVSVDGSISSPLTYSVAAAGASSAPWLSAGGAAATCNGVSRSTFNATLVAASALTPCDGVDARLGAYDAVCQRLAPSDGDAACALAASVRYYAAHDAFEFALDFDAAGVPGTATAPLPSVGGWPSGRWPLASAFPAFASASRALGFLNTHGNLLSSNFAWSRSSWTAYAGGLQGGPLLLFNASAAPPAAAGGAHPPALVLSPRTHAKSVFVTPWEAVQSPPPPPPPATNMSGVWREVDHGQMDPLACVVAVQRDGSVVATFYNGDPRAATVWSTANCTVINGLTCVRGFFWTSSGQPFATQNWTATLSANFSLIATSEGSLWERQAAPAFDYLGAGALSLGGDLPVLNGNMTLADAQLLCTGDAACVAFTLTSASRDCGGAASCFARFSSLSDFSAAPGYQSYAKGASSSGIAAGVSGIVAELPASFAQRVLLVGRAGGIAAAWSGWGAAMTAGMPSGGRFTLDADIYNRQTHYMTDNGAIFCYCNDVTGVPMRETIAELIAYHRAIGVRPALYHLDPFWHSHHLADGHCDGVTASAWNESEFHWAPPPSGGGLAALGVDIQMLFMLLAGPSKSTDRPGGNVYDGTWPMQASDTATLTPGSYDGVGGNSQVAAARALDFWLTVIGERVRLSRLRALVTDTLHVWHQGFASRLNGTAEQELWLDGLYGAASALGLPVRVDQSTPSDHLASAEFGWPAFVSARCGDDQDGGDTWTNMGTTGAFLASLQIRPVMDVLWTTATQPTRNGGTRAHIAHELIIAALTTGPVGIGDALNCTNATLLRLATRSDDVILKPAAAAVRLDAIYADAAFDGAGELWAAASAPARSAAAARDRRADSRAALAGPAGAVADGVWWWTLLATQVSALAPSVTPAALWPPAAPGTAFVLSEFGRAACVNGSAARTCLAAFGEGSAEALNATTAPGMAAGTAPRLWRLFSAAPVLAGGWILVGEEAKIVRVSPQRILAATEVEPAAAASDAVDAAAELAADGSGIAFRVIGAPGEAVRLTLVMPGGGGSAGSSSSSRSVGAAAAALAEGTIYLLDIVLPDSGIAAVQCLAGAGPRAAGCAVAAMR